MRAVVVLLLFALAAAWAQNYDAIPGEYMVLLKPGFSDDEFARHVNDLKGNFTLSGDSHNEVAATYQIGSDFKALFLRMTQDMLRKERRDPMVMVVEPNRHVHATQTCTTQSNAIWNLARIDERAIDFVDAEYKYDADGSNVNCYVIDTGILTTHVEFEGRAIWGTNTIDTRDVDCNGHGTHVASTVGGRLYGVAKKVGLIAAKCLDCGGSGTTNGVIAAINWSAAHSKTTSKRSTANMSLGGGFSPTMNAAVDAAVGEGITFVVAAGNSNTNACNFSPASATQAVSVGATTLVDNPDGRQQDRRAAFSNYGTCTHIWAPGQLITGAWIDRAGFPPNQATNIISGTSMASPHTCGVAALLLTRSALTPAQVKAQLVATSTPNVVDLACGGNSICLSSPNRFLFSGGCS